MVETYSLYGEQMAVTGAGGRLAALAGTGCAGVAVDLRGLPDWLADAPRMLWHVSSKGGPDELPGLRVSRLTEKPYLLFEYRDDITFLLRDDGREMWGDWPRRYDVTYVAPMVLGPVMGAALRLMGVSTLHASVVEINGYCVAITGRGGIGKSTTAGAFAQLGFGILSDDLAPIRREGERFVVAPGYPRVCLWPESVRILFGSPDALPPISEDWDKRYLDLRAPAFRFCETDREIRAIYWIAERTDDPRAPLIEPMPVQMALMTLVANTYATELPDRSRAARDLAFYSELVSRIPVRRVVSHRDPAMLPQLCQTIAEDFTHVLG